jgi:hypothetical protein
MGDDVGTFVAGVIYVAIVFVLVRPGSSGPQLISTLTGGMVDLVKAATGGGTFTAGTAPIAPAAPATPATPATTKPATPAPVTPVTPSTRGPGGTTVL